MIKYNIYRLRKQAEQALIEKLENVRLHKLRDKEIDGLKLSFFFSEEPDQVEIWWADTYSEFFYDTDKPQNLIYFGVLLISSTTDLYAVSLGKTHFYLRQYCDSDFGLNLAQRIADPKDFRIKNSKFYKSAKSKTITTYQRGIKLSYDSGESIHYLKAKTVNAELWGKTASFGSSVQLTLPISPLELPTVIVRIEQELLKPPAFELPKAELINNAEKVKQLDRRLIGALLGSTTNSQVSVDEFSVSGVDFIFSDRNNYSLYLKGLSRDKVAIGELSLEKLKAFISQKNINLHEKLDHIQVYCANEVGKGHSDGLKFYLDYIDDDKHCLIDGKWHKFNESYIKYLQNEVDAIDLHYDETFDITLSVDEGQFNNERAYQNNYQILHRSLDSIDSRFKVEMADLYKDSVLYFIKKGTPQKLSYVIDQATNTNAALQHNLIQQPGIVIKALCLWLILERQTKIPKLSNINSLIFQMKLVEWKKAVVNAGYMPQIKLNYAT